MDSFVRGILGARLPVEKDGVSSSCATRGSALFALQWEKYSLEDASVQQDDEREERGSLHTGISSCYSTHAFQSLFGYALIFINFTFVVAAMLLIMSGIVASGNPAVRLCEGCSRIAMAALVFGIILWIFTIFGFMWIRQRQIMFLLVYVAFLVILFIALLSLIIAAFTYDQDTQVSLVDPRNFFDAWERGVNETYTGQSYDVCFLQKRFNCSGFRDGCCVPGACYNTSAPPTWVRSVCPLCTNFPPISPVVCTGAVYSTVQKNLGGFLVISFFSMILVVSGIVFAFLSRNANLLM